jgi:hypothetical protein
MLLTVVIGSAWLAVAAALALLVSGTVRLADGRPWDRLDSLADAPECAWTDAG